MDVKTFEVGATLQSLNAIILRFSNYLKAIFQLLVWQR
jgi:hypothetical protein